MADPLSTRVAEYVADQPAATPDDVLQACDLDDGRREQVKHYLVLALTPEMSLRTGGDVPQYASPDPPLL